MNKRDLAKKREKALESLQNDEDAIRIGRGLVKGLPHAHSLLLEHMSPSFILAWNRCPASTALDVLFPRPEETSALKVGSEVHRILERRYNPLSKTKVRDLTPAENREVEQFIQAYDSIPDYNQGARSVEHETELEVKTTVTPLGVKIDTPLKGVIDRLDIADNGVFVVDYKTARKPISSCKYLDQLTIYKWLIESEYDTDVADCYVASMYRDKPRYIREKITLASQSKLIDKIKRTEIDVACSRDMGSYKKQRGWQCKYCPHREFCRRGSWEV